MNKIKVFCMHPSVKNLTDMIRYLCIEDVKICENFVWDRKEPDYIFVTEHIYLNKKYFDNFLKYYKRTDTIFIFHGGESIYPDLNIFDYAIVYSDKLRCDERVSKIPPEIFFKGVFGSSPNKNTLPFNEAIESLKGGKKFCNFIYSNPNANPMRDKLFYAISSYKKVDSLGKHLNNTNRKSTRGNANWGELSIQQKSKYKFTIACENELFEGYTTEKLLTSFRAHSVPIYWGNPYVAEKYNPDSFINCHDYSSFDEIINKIKLIDENDELWAKMVSAPWKTSEQEKNLEIEIENYKRFIEKIFSQSKESAHKRPEGTYTTLYSRWFFRKFNPPRTIKDSLRPVYGKIIGRKKPKIFP